MILKKFAVAASLASMAMPAAAATTNYVVNGDFESFTSVAPPADWGLYTSIDGWSAPAGSGPIEVQSNATLGHIDAADAATGGNYYVELDSTRNSSMTQVINLMPGLYTLSFAYSPRINDLSQMTNAISYSFGNIITNGEVSGPTANYPWGSWTMVSHAFTVQFASDYTLLFSAAGTSDSLGGLIDMVSITRAPGTQPSPVPLPAAGLLLAGALGGLGALRRRRKA